MRALRRWLGVLTIAAVLAGGCVIAGIWQWNRHLARSAAVAAVQANYDAPPVEIAEVLDPEGLLAPGDVWQPVSVIGHYLPHATVLLRNRPVTGQPAFQVLELFGVEQGELAGKVLVVNRGWVPVDAPVPAPPGGTTELVVRLRQPEPATDRDAPPGQVHAIAVEQVLRASGADLPALPAYGVVVSENAAPGDLAPLPAPPTDLGPHLSYAFQWWVFALGAVVGAFVLLLRRPGGHPRATGRTTDEEEEDALVDAAAPAGSSAR